MFDPDKKKNKLVYASFGLICNITFPLVLQNEDVGLHGFINFYLCFTHENHTPYYLVTAFHFVIYVIWI